ncbi:MAG TPA: hypothetical protein VK083_12655 [Nocardia sp.]|uniref:hypothetical protein n=1 Tax=Nocardia sp. TaxID=1821 RepID=UPI002B4AC664|nr:hypothetical protein [Nocardia sp.]HLS77632.1 hypothetical protein [Nocardia sp.]
MKSSRRPFRSRPATSRLALLGALAVGSAALFGGAPAAAEPAHPQAPTAVADNPLLRGAAEPGDLLGAYQDAVEVLRGLGVDPFLYPTAAAFCGDGPLGLVPAAAGAVPGPWPQTIPLELPGVDLRAVESGETLFAFVPYGIDSAGIDSAGAASAGAEYTADTTGMQVLWLNISTGRGGSAAMGSVTDVIAGMIPPELTGPARTIAESALTTVFGAVVPMGGIRAVPVETGEGTVLAAVFGTVGNGERSCFFLPTVGITNVS